MATTSGHFLLCFGLFRFLGLACSIMDGIIKNIVGEYHVYVQIQDGTEHNGPYKNIKEAIVKYKEMHMAYNYNENHEPSFYEEYEVKEIRLRKLNKQELFPPKKTTSVVRQFDVYAVFDDGSKEPYVFRDDDFGYATTAQEEMDVMKRKIIDLFGLNKKIVKHVIKTWLLSSTTIDHQDEDETSETITKKLNLEEVEYKVRQPSKWLVSEKEAESQLGRIYGDTVVISNL